MVNHRKVIFSLLKEIKENKSEPKAGDYGLETAEFGDIVDMMLDEKLITGASVSRGAYILQVYNATDVVIKEVKFSGGDAALLVNGSEVTVENVIITNAEFGGIEVSQGVGVTKVPKLTVLETLTYSSIHLPAIWIDGKKTNDGWVLQEGLNELPDIDKNQLWFVDATFEEVTATVTIANAKLAAKDASVKIEGVLTAYVNNNSFTIEDATGAMLLYVYADQVATLEAALGKTVTIEGIKDTYKGNEQLKDITFTVGEVATMPAVVSLDTGALDGSTLLPHQAKFANINDVTVSGYSKDSYGNVSFTLTRQDAATISFRWDSHVTLPTEVAAKLNALQNGDIINIENANIGWYYNPQLLPTQTMVITDVVLTDAQKVDLIKAALVEDYNAQSYHSGSTVALATTHPIYGGTITWSYNPVEAVVDGKWVAIGNANTQVVATANIDVSGATGTQAVTVTVKVAAEGEETFTETFDASTATTSYGDGTFTGVNGVVWTYVHSRDEGLGTKDNSSIEGKGIMLRRADEPSSLSATFTNGIGEFSFEYRKAFTGKTTRTYKVDVTHDGTTTTYDVPDFGSGSGADATVHTFSQILNLSGEVVIKIYATGETGNQQATFDNFTWTTN